MKQPSLSPLQKQVLKLIQQHKSLRPRDLEALNIPGEYLWQLAQAGHIKRLDRGFYVPADWQENERISLIQACQQVPHGVICLLSALAFHQLTLENPFEVWMAIPPKSYRPRPESLSMRYLQMSEPAFSCGMVTTYEQGLPLRVYNIPKTIADCFRFRNKIGLDVAVMALKEALNNQRCSQQEIWEYALVNRVQQVIYPYLVGLQL